MLHRYTVIVIFALLHLSACSGRRPTASSAGLEDVANGAKTTVCELSVKDASIDPVWKDDIELLFRSRDKLCMIGFGLDLEDYESVKESSGEILQRVQGADGRRMPTDCVWPKKAVTRFKKWRALGHPEE